jgi:hypothetical protein
MDGSSVLLEIDETRRRIRVSVVGPLSDSVLGECSRSARALPEFKEGYGALLDLQRITTVDVTSEAMVHFGQRAQNDINRVAILSENMTMFGLAMTYEAIADLGGNRVRVFTDEEPAEEWVSEH